MKRILAAVDTSETSRLVVARAVELARATGAKVRLFHAVSMPPIPPPPAVFVPLQGAPTLEAARAALAVLLEDVPESLRDGVVVEVGGAADAVCAAARACAAAIVVIGAGRYGVLARMLGTTAARIVNRIDRPVLVVRPMPADPAPETRGAAERSVDQPAEVGPA